jgi:hypothetical protein
MEHVFQTPGEIRLKQQKLQVSVSEDVPRGGSTKTWRDASG